MSGSYLTLALNIKAARIGGQLTRQWQLVSMVKGRPAFVAPYFCCFAITGQGFNITATQLWLGTATVMPQC